MSFKTLLKCPRCGEEHKNIELKWMNTHLLGYSHFAMCPKLDEPILAKYVDKDSVANPQFIDAEIEEPREKSFGNG